MKSKKILPLLCFLLLAASLADINACTGIMLSSSKNISDPSRKIVHGRTLEFAKDIDPGIAFVPRGIEYAGKTDLGEGLPYTTKYAMLGTYAFFSKTKKSDSKLILDGINEAGLAIGSFYFSATAGYPDVSSENRSKALSPSDFPNWVLSQFKTVGEVKGALEEGDAVIVSTNLKEWGNQPPPFHYVVYDKDGNCLVIEPVEQKLLLFDNPLGVFTNDPAFDWHMTNLRNYISLSPSYTDSVTFSGVKLEKLGLGNGMFGLPGDFTSPSRFVRASVFTVTAPTFKKPKKGILQLFHLLGNFDIPVGVSVTDKGELERTWCIMARDPQNLTYYFKTYDDQKIRVVNMKHFDKNGKEVLVTGTSSHQNIDDISSRLK